MTTEKTVLARWSMDIEPKISSDSFRQRYKLTLAELFTGFARALLDDQNIDLAMNHEVELSIETEHLNQRLVLKLIKMEK